MRISGWPNRINTSVPLPVRDMKNIALSARYRNTAVTPWVLNRSCSADVCIIITAAPEIIPEELVQQLAIGGRMILPVGSHFQDLILITKTAKGIHKKSIIPVRFVPMIHPADSIPD